MKRRFASKADEALQQRQQGLANAARRRWNPGAAQASGAVSAAKKGAISGGGLGGGQSFTPNPSGKFTPRTPTGRPGNFGGGKKFDIKFGMQPKIESQKDAFNKKFQRR